ncbi:hypothetical protein ACFL0C_01935 [Patescibacteria group bacterium]
MRFLFSKALVYLQKKSTKTFFAYFLSIIFIYFLFFPNIYKYHWAFWESDVETKHFPTREYLRNTIVEEKRFPFWTEKVFLGFPIYADLENAYLNIPNFLSILVFGPMTSFKITHLLTYLVGSFSFYFLLKKFKAGMYGSIAAVLVYYFSYFHLNHLIHYNMISISMLLPLNILLVQLFLDTKNKKYVLFQSLILAYGLYWGHPQTTILVFIGICFYVFVFGADQKLKQKIQYLVFSLLIAICLFLPQLIPSSKLFFQSLRSSEISSTQGSLTPELSISYAFPYIFSTWSYYYGKEAGNHFSYTELYNYVGIGALTILVVYLLKAKRNKLFWYSYFLFWIFSKVSKVQK